MDVEVEPSVTGPEKVLEPVTDNDPLMDVEVEPSVNDPVLGLNTNAVVANTVLVL